MGGSTAAAAAAAAAVETAEQKSHCDINNVSSTLSVDSIVQTADKRATFLFESSCSTGRGGETQGPEQACLCTHNPDTSVLQER
jgi:hypothetical protein